MREGINVKKWCRAHEHHIEEVKAADPGKEELSELIKVHEKKLSWLMHERLIHLIVMFITVTVTLFSLALLLFMPQTVPASLIMFVLSFILLFFYVKHYFFLENTVQSWYVIDEELNLVSSCRTHL